MADAYTYTSDVYPYNVNPQFRSNKPSKPLPKLKCPQDESEQYLMVDNSNVVVVKGWEVKSGFDIKQMFIPVENYLSYEFTLKARATTDEYITLDYGNVAVNGGIPMIIIFPQYWETSLDEVVDSPVENMIIHYRFSTDQSDLTVPENWGVIGKFWMQHTSKLAPLPPILLQNRTGQDIPIKIMLVS